MIEPTHPSLLLPARDPDNISAAARLLRDGKVVAIPTDTLYGLSAAVFCEEAVTRIYAIKRRPGGERVPVLFSSAADLPLLVGAIPRSAWTLIGRFWPGPLTLVLEARPSAPQWITGGRGTVAVRVPAARSTLELLEVVGEPVVGTSANRHGAPPALTAEQVRLELGGEIAAILEDDAAIVQGRPSTVAAVTSQGVQVLREGVVDLGALRAALGPRTTVKAAAWS